MSSRLFFSTLSGNWHNFNVSLFDFHLQPMFQSIVTHIRLTYAIDGQLIAIGNTTWQTKNLTSVSVEQAKLAVVIPAPLFTGPAELEKSYAKFCIEEVTSA